MREKMSQKSSTPPARVPAEKLMRDIRRATRKHHPAEDKIRIVWEGLAVRKASRPGSGAAGGQNNRCNIVDPGAAAGAAGSGAGSPKARNRMRITICLLIT